MEILDLSQNRLRELPADFGRLKKLRILFLSENDFETLPEVLRDCPELSMIGFKSNRIVHVPADALPPNVHWLILTDNRIETLPDTLGRQKHLQKLMLAGNRLRTLPSTMAACRNLELVRIAANRFEQIPSWLFTLPRLSWLACAGNPCSHAPEGVLDDPQRIAWEELHVGEQLGSGASGIIHHARHLPEAKNVAVKFFKGSVTSDGYPADEMRACIAAGEHGNLTTVHGRLEGHPEDKEGLVLSLIPPRYKNLGNPPSLETCTRDTYDKNTRFTLFAIKRIATDIASAAAHLHARGIMHGDLYAHNILIDNKCHTLMGDFGAASFYDHNTAGNAFERLEVRAYGALLEDLLLRLKPVGSPKEREQVARLWDLTRTCMSEKVEKRPLFLEICEKLEHITTHGSMEPNIK